VPDCGRQSTAVHSTYVRQLRDLPILGKPVELQALVRRFRCRNSDCARITFSESLGWLAKRYAQRTDRVTDVLRSLVSTLSRTLSTILASAIGIRTSSSTLLRAVDRSYCLARAPRVLSIDDSPSDAAEPTAPFCVTLRPVGLWTYSRGVRRSL
jgi:transposase